MPPAGSPTHALTTGKGMTVPFCHGVSCSNLVNWAAGWLRIEVPAMTTRSMPFSILRVAPHITKIEAMHFLY